MMISYVKKVADNNLFKRYIYVEKFRKQGVDLITDVKRWLRYDVVKDAVLYGGVAKLSLPFLRDVAWWQILIFVIGYSLFNDFLSWFVGRYYYRKGFQRKQNEINTKDEQLAPFNVQLERQILEHSKALQELTGKEVPNHFKKY